MKRREFLNKSSVIVGSSLFLNGITDLFGAGTYTVEDLNKDLKKLKKDNIQPYQRVLLDVYSKDGKETAVSFDVRYLFQGRKDVISRGYERAKQEILFKGGDLPKEIKVSVVDPPKNFHPYEGELSDVDKLNKLYNCVRFERPKDVKLKFNELPEEFQRIIERGYTFAIMPMTFGGKMSKFGQYYSLRMFNGASYCATHKDWSFEEAMKNGFYTEDYNELNGFYYKNY